MPNAQHTELILLASVEDRHSIESIHATSITNAGRPIDYPEPIESPLSSALAHEAAEDIFDPFYDEIVNFFWSKDCIRDANLFVVWYNEIEEWPYVDVVAMRFLSDEYVSALINKAIESPEEGTWQ